MHLLRLKLLRILSLFVFLVPLWSQSGFVLSGGQPVPGATLTAKQGDTTVTTLTDAEGHYGFPLLASGVWDVSVEMWGFETVHQQIEFASAKGPVNFDLKLHESPMLQSWLQGHTGNGPQDHIGNAPQGQRGQGNGAPQQGANPSPTGPSQNRPGSGQQGGAGDAMDSAFAAASADASGQADTLLIAGSLSPGMQAGRQADSGPDARFAPGGPGGGDITSDGGGSGISGGQGGGFGGPGGGGGFGGPGGGFGGGRGGGGGFGGPGGGGRRPGGGRPGSGGTFGNRSQRRNQIHGMASFTLVNSATNAKPFSLNGSDIPQAAYAQSRFSLIVGGPLIIPKLIKDPSTQFFVTYFGTRSRTPQLFVETVPTQTEESGNFSQAVQSLGASAKSAPVMIFNPLTGQQFTNNQIPANQINPIAQRLLQTYYPAPNQPGLVNNYQFETAQAANTDNLGIRLQRNVTAKDRLSLNFQYQDRDGTTAQPLGYSDTTSGYGLNTQLQWTRNLSPTVISTLGIRFNRNRNQLTPYFANGPNVASELGIPGTSSNPLDYGPPTLNFTNFAALSDGTASLTRNQTEGVTETITALHGLHTVTAGFGYSRANLATLTDPNGRGTFSFTGLFTSILNGSQPVAGTGYDLADFLLGDAQSTSIRYGDSSNYFYQDQYSAYAQDEWKLKPSFTLTAGLRYEFFSPLAQKYGRMSNLDIAPGFANVALVLPNEAGTYSGYFPSGLIDPDRNNWAPRVAVAWRIPSKKSTVFRAGYGIYYNEQAYISLGEELAQQPPFATSNAINASANNPLTLAQGFLTTSPADITNTYAVDRNYRTPYAQSWNANIQRDLANGLFVEVGYQGTKGTRLDIRTLPNEAPEGSSAALLDRNQLGQATGFTFDQSVGNSIFHALQLRAVRRFNHGISFNAFYQFAKSIDDSSTFGGSGNTVAQNWLDISAERGLSSFDVRHEFQTSFVWTSPAGAGKSRITAESKLGRLLKDWQLSGSVTAQTGNPLTARVLGNTAELAQTGGVGRGRAEATGEGIDAGSGFFNLDAFAVPLTGTYGNAGRNTIPGPGLVSLNTAFARSFTLSERRRLEFRLEGNNVLNHVNYTNLYTVVNAANYGLPSAAGAMRTLDAVVRFRF